jgi:hypothetical protein
MAMVRKMQTKTLTTMDFGIHWIVEERKELQDRPELKDQLV